MVWYWADVTCNRLTSDDVKVLVIYMLKIFLFIDELLILHLEMQKAVFI